MITVTTYTTLLGSQSFNQVVFCKQYELLRQLLYSSVMVLLSQSDKEIITLRLISRKRQRRGAACSLVLEGDCGSAISVQVQGKEELGSCVGGQGEGVQDIFPPQNLDRGAVPSSSQGD